MWLIVSGHHFRAVIVAQWITLPLTKPTSHIRILDSLLLIQFSVNQPGNAMENNTNIWVPVINMADPAGALESWPRPGPDLAAAI